VACVVEDLGEDENGDPSERDAGGGGPPFRRRDPGDLRGNRKVCAGPDDRQDCDLGTVENEEPEGGVGAGDEGEDAGVVDAAKPWPCVGRTR
jgi:hypothetical protein